MIEGTAHIGISVADLDRSIQFYRDGLGMEVVVDTRFGGELYERILDLEGATGRVALLEAPGLQLELFEFSAPAAKRSDPERRVCDHGITHFCIRVDDIDDMYARLFAAGVRFHCPPLDFRGIAKATYGRDPDGNVFELLQVPESR